jgi:hypothetical protein
MADNCGVSRDGPGTGGLRWAVRSAGRAGGRGFSGNGRVGHGGGGGQAAATGAGVHPIPVQLRAGRRRAEASQTFTLANSGRPATGRLTVRLTSSAAFTISGDTCKSLAPRKTCTVTARFAPTGTGTATLTAASKKQATATDVLTGTGTVGGPLPVVQAGPDHPKVVHPRGSQRGSQPRARGHD